MYLRNDNAAAFDVLKVHNTQGQIRAVVLLNPGASRWFSVTGKCDAAGMS